MQTDADLPTTQADLDAPDLNRNPDKPRIRTGLRSDTTVVQLTMAFQIAGMLDKVNQTNTADWPDILVTNIVARLKHDYQPIDRILRVETRRKLNEVSMNNYDDPKVIFEQMSTIKNHYAGSGVVVKDEDLMASITEKVPDKYTSNLVIKARVQ